MNQTVTLVGDSIENPANALVMKHAAAMLKRIVDSVTRRASCNLR